MFDRGVTVLRIRGIPVKLHITLLIFLPYVAFVAATQFSVIATRIGVPREALRLPPLAWGAILAVGLFSLVGSYFVPFALELKLPARETQAPLAQLMLPAFEFPSIRLPERSAAASQPARSTPTTAPAAAPTHTKRIRS